ncbi:MAG TPA: hypothetical protein VMD59_02730, partial [Acidimicrobiales bacterium]|nr:hypothetical protein [Acidimicrobiales bacterium]
GQMLLRRSYAYDDGLETSIKPASLDAGLFFVSYQQNPRLSFIPMFESMSRSDALREYAVHTASAVAAVPPAAVRPGDWIGRQLFEL